jgi:hypothetical protein
MTTTKTAKIAIVELPASTRTDPVIRRRELCAEKLLDQKKLIENPDYVRVTQRYSGKGADRKATEKKTVVRPWWVQMMNGVALRLRFVSGRQGVVVGSMTELPAAIDELIEQIKAGELDQMITPAKAKPVTTATDAKKPGKSGKRRAA